MQGRLLPKFQGKYQSHPIDNWEKEFHLANKYKIRNIEFIIDAYKPELNPLINLSGIKKIKELEKKYNVKVYSICADYFMENPIHIKNSNKNYSLDFLKILIFVSGMLKIKNIILPCVDQSTLKKNKKYENNLIKNILKIKKLLKKNKVNLLLETDLPPKRIKKILNKINFKYFGINYDTGNSAGLNFNIAEEFKVYGKFIKEIHIKDRKKYGGSVKLGNGNANFKVFFEELKKLNYKGAFILQPYRDYEGKKIFLKQFEWFKSQILKYN